MTLSSVISRVAFTGNGVTTAFSFPYYFLASTDLKVIRKTISDGTETPMVLNTDYTVAGAGVAAGGTVTTIGAMSPLSALYKIVIYRDPLQTQETDLVENDSLPAEPVEKVFDRLTMISQRLNNWLSRTVKLSEGMPDNIFDPTLPVDINLYPESVPLVNAAGTGFKAAADWPTATDIEDAEENAAAAAVSAAAALVSENNADASEAAAAASAASAAATLASAFFRDVVYKTFADSPVTVNQAMNGKFLSLDTSGGTIVVNLPSIAGLVLPFNIGFVKTSSSNSVTINRNGTDTIFGATSKTLTASGTGCQLAADTDAAPDDWAVQDFGDVANGAITTAKLATGAVTSVKRVETFSAVKTSNYTIDAADGIVLGDDTAGAFTFTLPAASTMSGKQITLKKVEAATAQYRITIDGNGAETIGGALTKKLATPGESYTIMSDGSNWHVLYHHYAFTKTFTPVFTDGAGTALTYGTTTIKKGRITRISPKWALVRYDVKQTTAGSGGAVAGLYYKMPQYFQVDLTADGVDAAGAATNYGEGLMGSGEWFYGGTTNYDLRPYLFDTDNFEMSTKSNPTGWSYVHFATTWDFVSFAFVPIVGWDD